MNLLRRFPRVAVAVVLLAGCQAPFHDARTVQVETGGIKAVIYDAHKKAKKVRVEVHAQGTAVDAYLLLEKDRAAAEEAIAKDGEPAAALAAAKKVQDGTLEATIPAGSAFAVVVVNRIGSKEASVALKAVEVR
jgi:hypothetical protein